MEKINAKPEAIVDHRPTCQEKREQKFNKKLVPIEGKCIFRLPKKARLCYQQVNEKDSKNFCRFHLDQEYAYQVNLKRAKRDEDGEQKVSLDTDEEKELELLKSKYEMVFCPYEPKNAVLKDKLQEHLKTCPKRLELEVMSKKAWYSEGVNFANPSLPSCFEMSEDERKANQLKNLDAAKLQVILGKIDAFYDKLKETRPDL